MIFVPISVFLEPGSVFFFSHPSLKGRSGHYHVVAKIVNGIAYLVCCTSQYQKVYNFVTSRRLGEATMVGLNNCDFLQKVTVANCNYVYPHTLSELHKRYPQHFKYAGQLSDENNATIINGIIASRMVSREIKKIFS